MLAGWMQAHGRIHRSREAELLRGQVDQVDQVCRSDAVVGVGHRGHASVQRTPIGLFKPTSTPGVGTLGEECSPRCPARLLHHALVDEIAGQ